MNELTDILLSLITLTILEIVLGIDNLIFLSIISQKLPTLEQQKRARRIGLTLAWAIRLILLAAAIWITKLTYTLFTLFGMTFSWRDLFLLVGGLFLLTKATQEIHDELEPSSKTVIKKAKPFVIVVVQITILDMIFSLDSVLTAIGLTKRFWLMAVAITIAILMMIFASEPLSRFIKRYPTVRMLALSFLILIGTTLIADSFKFDIPRGYIYFAMAFSLMIESLNILKRKYKRKYSTKTH